METLKSFRFFSIWLVVFIFSIFVPDLTVDALYKLFGVDKAAVLDFLEKHQMNILTFGIGIIAAFQFRADLDRYKRRITKTKIFIEKAIRYGEALNKSKLLDAPYQAGDGRPVDETDLNKFRKLFRDWHFCIHTCFKNAFSNFDQIHSWFVSEEVAFNFAGQWTYGGLRKCLLQEIEELKKLKERIKSDQLEKDFDVEIFKEYENFKLP